MGDAPVVVLDCGSGTVKAGLASPEAEPLVVAPCAVLCKVEGGSTEAEPLYPVQRAEVVDWEQLECVLHHVFYEQLGWEFNHEGSVLLAEPSFVSRRDRERFTQMLFERFNVHGLYVAEAPVLSLYSVGRISGTVIDVGHGRTDVVPVQEGATVPNAVRKLAVGGVDLTARLRALLSGELGEGADYQALKHQCLRVGASAEEYRALVEEGAAETYALPDGKTITVPVEGVLAGEALFQPSVLGSDHGGLVEEVYTSITACQADTRRPLFESLLLCGGGAAIKGLDARLLADLTDLAPTSRPALVTPPEYMHGNTLRYSAWTGGAILAKLVFPQNQFVSKGEYDEAGPSVIHRKCATT